MRLTFCGVRGSTPALGTEFLRVGGHTSCVAVAHGDDPPTLVLDAGTGIRTVSSLLGGSAFTGSILLSHLHWDHTQGLPFFTAADRSDAGVDLYIPAQGDTEAVLARAMSPPHFPITPRGLLGDWRFFGLDPGISDIEGFTIQALEIPHKGGRTFGFRISDGGATFSYLSDHCPTVEGPGPDGLGERHEAALALAGGCDLLVHDAQYTDEEFPSKAHFGHASVGYAVGLAEVAGAQRMLLFHHAPSRTDDQVDAIVASCAGSAVDVDAASEHLVLDLP